MPLSRSVRRRPQRKQAQRVAEPDYDRSIFINCPFDERYRPLFQALIFAVSDCGYIPHCALEVYDSGQVRIEKIFALIERCRFGIHDISRTELDPGSDLPRFNMPLELGIFLGAQRFGVREHKRKISLIFDKERYRYQRFISDISGQDVAAHGDDTYTLISMVRDWLSTASGGDAMPGGRAIATRFAAFQLYLPSVCARLHLHVEELTFANYANMIRTWLIEQPQRPPHLPARPVIAVDGPAAAGKGTLARRIAATLGLPYLDTGLLYRAVGRLVLDAGGDPADPQAAEAAARALVPADLGRDDLRGPVADAAAAAVAAIPAVRAALLDFQRGFATERGAVLDGRDIGTVIFPDAPVKLYVTASLAERARRRWQELQAKGIAAEPATVAAEMLARDTRDAPNMRRAADAVVLDTSSMDAEAVFQQALEVVRLRLEGTNPADITLRDTPRNTPPR